MVRNRKVKTLLGINYSRGSKILERRSTLTRKIKSHLKIKEKKQRIKQRQYLLM